MDNFTEQEIEEVSSILVTKWSSIFDRLQMRGFSRREALSLVKAYVVSSNVTVEFFNNNNDEL